MNTPNTSTGTITATGEGVTLTADFAAQTLTLIYAGFFTPKHKKQLGTIEIPFEHIDDFEWEGKRYVYISIHGHRPDWNRELRAVDASDDPLVFSVLTKAERAALQEMFTAIKDTHLLHTGRPFTLPSRKKGFGYLPPVSFGEISLDGNDVVYKKQRFPIAGATAEINAGGAGATGLSVGRAVVGGALLGGAGAVLGGVTGKKGEIILGVKFADGTTVMTTGPVKQMDKAVALANEIGRWGPKLAA